MNVWQNLFNVVPIGSNAIWRCSCVFAVNFQCIVHNIYPINPFHAADVSFYTPWKQKTRGFQMFVGDIETKGRKWVNLAFLFITLYKHLLLDEQWKPWILFWLPCFGLWTGWGAFCCYMLSLLETYFSELRKVVNLSISSYTGRTCSMCYEGKLRY